MEKLNIEENIRNLQAKLQELDSSFKNIQPEIENDINQINKI